MQKKTFRAFYLFIKMAISLTLSLCVVTSGFAIVHACGEIQSKVKIPETPQRIVVFPLFAEEMLLEMIGPDRIVYVGHEYHENGEAHSPTMMLTEHIPGNDWQNTGNEELLELEPDLVVLSEEFLIDYEMIYPELVQKNIAFFFLNTPETIEDIKNNLLILGEVVDAPEKAAQMVRDMEASLSQITEIVASVPDEQRMRAAYWGREPQFPSGEECRYFPNNFSIIAHAAGVINASGSDTDYKAISLEQLVEWNPDLLTVIPVDYNSDGSICEISDDFVNKFIASFLNQPELSSVTAIRNRNVHPLRLSNSQFIVQSVKDLARLAYPNLFREN